MWIIRLTFDTPLFGIDNEKPIYFMDDCGNIGFTNDEESAWTCDELNDVGDMLNEINEHLLDQEIGVETFTLVKIGV